MKRFRMLLCQVLSAAVLQSPATAADIAWTNSAGGSWSTTSNWSPNQVPGSADVAVITNAATYTVVLDISTTIGGLRIGGPAGNQTLLINGPLVVNGASTINSNGFVSLFAGMLGGAGDISVAGLLNVFGGSLASTGILSIKTNGQMQVNGNVDLGGRTIVNGGRLLWTTGDFLNGRAFTNLAGGIFDILLSGNNTFSCTQTGMNAGLIRQMNGGGNLNLPFNNSGAIQVERGMVGLGGGGTHTGTINVSSNATIGIGFLQGIGLAAGTFDFEPASTTTGDGNVFLGTVNLRGTFELKGTNTVSGTANFFSGYTLNGSPLILGGRPNFNTGKALSPSRLTGIGILSGTDSIVVSGPTAINSGIVTNYSGTIHANGGLTVGHLEMYSGVLNNAGSATVTSDLYLYGGRLNNLPGATFYVPSAYITGTPEPTRAATFVFDNTGVVRCDFCFITTIFTNRGVVQGTWNVTLAGNGTHSGAFQLENGATLRVMPPFGNGPTVSNTFSPDSRIIGSGSTEFRAPASVQGVFAITGTNSITDAAVEFTGSYQHTGTVSVASGSLKLNTGQPVNLTRLIASGGTVMASDPISVSGPMIWSGGTLAGPGSISANGGGTINGLTMILNGATLNIGGLVNWSRGSIFTGAGSVINNLAAGILDITGDVQTLAGFGGSRSFTNAGIIRRTAGTGTATISDAFYNRGSVEARSGTLAFGSTFVQEAGSTLLSGGSMAAMGPLVIDGGSFGGSGTIAASVINGGRCAPGFSAGLLRINGNYEQTPGGELSIELGGLAAGSGFDQLQVSGSAALNGALNVSEINGFNADGQSFRILTFGSRTGDFSSFNDSTGNGLARVYDATGLTLAASNGAPAISIVRDGQQMTLSWPNSASAYTLQWTTNVSSNWIDIPSSTNMVTVPATNAQCFFRLARP